MTSARPLWILAIGLVACGTGLFGTGEDPDVRADAGASNDAALDGDLDERTPLTTTCVVADDAAGRRNREAGSDFFAPYVTEILAHAGIPFTSPSPAELVTALEDCAVVVLAHEMTLDENARESLERFVRDGGTAIAIGGPAGLEQMLGVAEATARDEGYVDFEDELGGPLPRPPLPLHVFGGVGFTATTAEAVARWLDVAGNPTDQVAMSRQSFGAGEAWLVGPDLPHSVVTIQQGRPISADGEPAPDGTAAIDDGILKTDDGIVLDWDLDRGVVGRDPLFLEPVADLIREVLLRLVLRGHSRRATRLPILWYWPGELDAVGIISHDTDGNDPTLARVLLDEVTAIGLESTWCFIRDPETLPPEFFADVIAAGGEISLHYDARTGTDITIWAEDAFLGQLAWLEGISGVEVTTNKNHYTRWEGWTEFYRWLERAGVRADQSKGPSKRGNVGFLYGTCQPFFPVDDAANDNRPFDVLAVNLFTQDLVHTVAYEVGPALVDRAVEHFGVAHFLFHPAHVEREGVVEAMRNVVEYGRSAGLEWWTVAGVDAWERARRRVTIGELDAGGFTATTPEPIERATLLVVLGAAEEDLLVRVNDTQVPWRPFAVYGVNTARFTVDLQGGATRVTLATGP